MRIALALPLEFEDQLAAEATRHGHEIVARCSSAQELTSRIAAVKPDVAIVAATERYLTSTLLSACDDAGVRILPLVAGGAERHYAESLGLWESADLASEWPVLERELAVLSVAPSEPSDVAGAVPPFPPAPQLPPVPPLSPGSPIEPSVSLRGRREPADLPASESVLQPTSTGVVIAVWGPAGAPGRTTVAINIAAELAAAGRSVALADVDTYSGSVAPTLGMLDEAPGFAAACRLAGSNALTRTELERIGQRHGSGRSSFWVLTGIGRPSRWPELSAARVSATLAKCREWVDFTVVDTGFSLEHDEEISSDLFAPRRNAASITTLREADRVVAVGAADPVGLSRFLRAHVDLVETVAEGRVIVAMNKIRASAIGLNPIGQVTQTLSRFGGIESAAMIPFDSAALDAAILSGRTLADAAPRSPARAAIRDLVTTRLLPKPVGKRALRAVVI